MNQRVCIEPHVWQTHRKKRGGSKRERYVAAEHEGSAEGREAITHSSAAPPFEPVSLPLLLTSHYINTSATSIFISPRQIRLWFLLLRFWIYSLLSVFTHLFSCCFRSGTSQRSHRPSFHTPSLSLSLHPIIAAQRPYQSDKLIN